jgi:hypothetical protein
MSPAMSTPPVECSLADSAPDPAADSAADAGGAEPPWPIMFALLATGGLYFALPESMSAGPHWLLLAIVAVLLVPTLLTYRRCHTMFHIVLGHALSGVVTAFMLWSVVQLVRSVFMNHSPSAPLLRSGALLWMTNVLVFASWYWRLDAGGPHARARSLTHTCGAFLLFPQMTSDLGDAGREGDGSPWSPKFVDYLFLSFNTSTAFSPTDTPVLSRWAKALMMVQSFISLNVTLILVARAVNLG